MMDESIFSFRVEEGPTPLDSKILHDIQDARLLNRGLKRF